VLTALGIKTRELLRESFWDPPQELVDLDIQTLEALSAALKKLPVNVVPTLRGPMGKDPAPR